MSVLRKPAASAKMILGIGAMACAQASGAQVSWAFDKTQIQWGERVTLNTSWTLTEEEQARGLGAPESWPAWTDTTAGGFEILNQGDITATEEASGDIERTTFRKDWILTSWDSGVVAIPPTPFGDDIAPAIQVVVIAPQLDTIPQDSLLQHLPAPAGIIQLEVSNWDKFLRKWGWWLPVILFIIVLIVLFIKRLNLWRDSSFGINPPTVHPPSSLALAQNSLDRILVNQPWKKDKAKEAHVEASLAIRRFLEDHYKIRATESTTQELLLLLRGSSVPANWQERLIQLLNQSDMIKYAKGELPDSIHQSMFETYRDFLSHHESTSKHEG